MIRSSRLLARFVLVSVYRLAFGAAMAHRHEDELLSLVGQMDEQFGRYLAGLATAREAVRHILMACERMRVTGVNDEMQIWLETIEQHAANLCCLRKASDDGRYLFSPTEFLRNKLLKDIGFLRLQIAYAQNVPL